MHNKKIYAYRISPNVYLISSNRFWILPLSALTELQTSDLLFEITNKSNIFLQYPLSVFSLLVGSWNKQTGCVFTIYTIYSPSLYRLLLLPPFGLYLCSLSINPALSKSRIALLTVPLDSFVSLQIVDMEGKRKSLL